MEPDRLKTDLPAEAEEKDVPNRAEKAFAIFAAVFFGLAVLVLLVMIYVNTAKNLTVSPYLSPILFLLFGGGIGFGMLFRTFQRKKENVSLINYFFKIAFCCLILLSTLLSFLISLLEILG